EDARAARAGDAPGAPPVEVPAALPLRLPASGGATLVTLDLGEESAGTVLLEVDAPAGARFDVAVAESLDEHGRLRRLQQHSGFRYVARGALDRFESFDPMGLRFVQISVRAPGGPVVLREVGVRERVFPRPAGAAFACSDELLTRIWAVGRRTVDLCSHDAYVDCPSREQRAWTGDAVVHQMVDLATSPDWSLARWHVELTATPRPDGMLPMAVASDMAAADATYIPDWPLHWVHALHELHRYTGDRELVARLLPVAESLLRWFEPFQQPDGLLGDVTGWVLIDWSAVSVAGKCAALNALWARALLEFAALAAWLGDAGRAAWARAAWGRVACGFDAFWDERRGVYVDHVLAGVPGRTVSQHANAAAICAALVPETRLSRVLRPLLDRSCLVQASWLLPGRTTMPEDGDMYAGAAYLLAGPPAPWWDVERQVVAAQPFFRWVVHDAVALAGQADRVADLCRDWQALLARCPTTFSETWFGGSRCHGWSATPTRDLVVHVLGVGPAEPGFTAARVAPRLGDLAWARGSVPTPFGLLHVDARRDRVDIDSPVPVEVVPHAGARRRLAAGRHVVEIAEVDAPA
ncbi:MAG: family 78 glycoside hydrolase catalytic domain, partial [Thermodesulfobacteriota bacterium]